MPLQLLDRPVEAKNVMDFFPQGQELFSIGPVKVDEVGFLIRNEDIFELEVSVEESLAMKLSDEKSCGTDHFPLFGEHLSIRR